MKNLKQVFVGSLLFVTALVLTSEETQAGSGPEWQVVNRDADSENSYDRAGVTRHDGNIITVTTRVAYTPKGKADALAVFKNPGFGDLAYSLYVNDTDCRNLTNKLLRVSHYDSKGGQIKSTDMSSVTEWEKIPPRSVMEVVADTECPR